MTAGANALVTEITSYITDWGSSSIKGQVTYMQKFRTNKYDHQKFSIRADGKGNLKMMYFFNAYSFNNERDRRNVIGYILRENLGSEGSFPLLTSVECGYPTTNLTVFQENEDVFNNMLDSDDEFK